MVCDRIGMCVTVHGYAREKCDCLQFFVPRLCIVCDYTLSPHIQLASNKQARLRSVLAITLSQCFGLYATLAIFCFDTWPSQI